MSLETALAENTAALRELIAALAASRPAPSSEPAAAATLQASTEPAASPATPVSYQDVARAVVSYQRAKGTPAARERLAAFGIDALPKARPEQYAAIIEAFAP